VGIVELSKGSIMKKIIRTPLLLAALLGAQAFALTRGMEWLDRGLVAVNTSGKNVFLSWRLLGNDPSTISFNIYRDGTKIVTIAAGAPTNYTDAAGSATAKYTIREVVNGTEQPADAAVTPRTQNWLSIPLSKPGTGYTPNDASTGDLDGDGQYEIVLKWDPSDSKDNSQSGATGNVYLDAYKLNGTRLWRIDLGQNIRAGAHYTQFQVADYDGDGKAELMVKTAPGTKDGSGTYLSKGSAASDNDATDYANSSGYILTGPEYLTVFNGQTGKEMATTNFVPARGTVSGWGDSYGNRVDRFLAATAWLGNGTKPSAVFQRGYYTRMAVTAWDWDGTTLKQRWAYDAKTSGSEGYGQGNHNLSVGDVDGDGYDEIIQGASAIDHDGKFMYRTGYGHGDAMHLGKMDPDNSDLLVWEVHEETGSAYGYELHNARTGKVIFGTKTGTDNGRGMAADIDSTSPGYEMWSYGASDVFSVKGKSLSTSRPSLNFRMYWDGDLQDEILDGTKLDKWTGNGTTRLVSFYNYPNATNCVVSNNTTKATPSLVADLFGDWREEVVFGTTNADSLIIFTTTIPTPHRMYTLMHDPVYRDAVAWQNSAYNQPPHLGFLLSDKAHWPTPNISLVNAPAVATNNAPVFTSGKSLSIPENTTAVVQCVATDADGNAVTYSITAGEDSAKFAINKTTGALTFKTAPDYEIPTDVGADNIYKVIVSATDGKAATTQSIAVLVTDVVDNTAAGLHSTALARAKVIWMDLRGNILREEEQWLNPYALKPVVPVGMKGMVMARILVAGQAPALVRAMGVAGN